MTDAVRACELPILTGKNDRVAKHTEDMHTGSGGILALQASKSTPHGPQANSKNMHLGDKRVSESE